MHIILIENTVKGVIYAGGKVLFSAVKQYAWVFNAQMDYKTQLLSFLPYARAHFI